MSVAIPVARTCHGFLRAVCASAGTRDRTIFVVKIGCTIFSNLLIEKFVRLNWKKTRLKINGDEVIHVQDKATVVRFSKCRARSDRRFEMNNYYFGMGHELFSVSLETNKEEQVAKIGERIL